MSLGVTALLHGLFLKQGLGRSSFRRVLLVKLVDLLEMPIVLLFVAHKFFHEIFCCFGNCNLMLHSRSFHMNRGLRFSHL